MTTLFRGTRNAGYNAVSLFYESKCPFEEGREWERSNTGLPSFPQIGLRLVSLAENTRITPGPGLYEDIKPAVGRISRTLRGGTTRVFGSGRLKGRFLSAHEFLLFRGL